MKRTQRAILVVLILMSLFAGAVKVLQMPQEVKFFQDAGLGVGLLILLGLMQIAGGVLTVFAKFRKPGAAIIAAGFLASTIVIFRTGNTSFGVLSLLPVMLAGYLTLTAQVTNTQ